MYLKKETHPKKVTIAGTKYNIRLSAGPSRKTDLKVQHSVLR